MNSGLLLCTDLDRTLLPNGPEPESVNARSHFRQLLNYAPITLAFVSGRHRALIEEAISEYALPQPAYVIGDVGSTLYEVLNPGTWRKDLAWEAWIAVDWHGRSDLDLEAMFSDLPELRLQEKEKQNRFKLSYYFPLDCDRKALEKNLRNRLSQSRIATNLIWSVDDAAGVGLLDLLPARANKLHAIEFLMKRLGLGLSNTLFAGDSGNDLEVLVSPIPAVLVANAQPQIRREALRIAELRGNQDALYLARGGFLYMNGNYSAGILEGLGHFHPGLIQHLAKV